MGSLVLSCCGEGGALQTNITGEFGEDPQCSGHTGFAPVHGCVLSPSTLLRLQSALQGAGPELHALPRPKPLRFRFAHTPQRCRLGWACFLCLPHPAAQAGRSLTSALPRCGVPYPLCGSASVSRRAGWVRLVSLLGIWSLAANLPADVNHPESQEVFG